MASGPMVSCQHARTIRRPSWPVRLTSRSSCLGKPARRPQRRMEHWGTPRWGPSSSRLSIARTSKRGACFSGCSSVRCPSCSRACATRGIVPGPLLRSGGTSTTCYRSTKMMWMPRRSSRSSLERCPTARLRWPSFVLLCRHRRRRSVAAHRALLRVWCSNLVIPYCRRVHLRWPQSLVWVALPVGMAVTVGMHAAHLLLRRRRRRHSKSKMAVCSLVRGCRRNLVL